MKPGEIINKEGFIELNKTSNSITIKVSNKGDRPIQVGSHYHFEEVNEFLEFVGKDPIIAHNVDFDIGFLNYELNACGKDSLKNEKIDTVSIAREKFPGQSVSLDALCKRFAIDNTQREKHSATIDTELLARVYIELMDARELSLDLNSVEVVKKPVTSFNIEKIKNRNLPSRLSDQEKKLHDTFIETLGEHSIWNKINQSKNNQTSE